MSEVERTHTSPDPLTTSYVPSLPEELTGDIERRLTEKPFDSGPVSRTSRSDASSPTPTKANPAGACLTRKRISTMRWNPVNKPSPVLLSSSSAPQPRRITYRSALTGQL